MLINMKFLPFYITIANLFFSTLITNFSNHPLGSKNLQIFSLWWLAEAFQMKIIDILYYEKHQVSESARPEFTFWHCDTGQISKFS